MRLYISLILLVLSTHGAAIAADCAKITDDKERLACFDAGAEPTPEPAEAATPSVQSRNIYGNAVRRTLLSSGIDMTVFWMEKSDPKFPFAGDKPSHYPQLFIFGYMNQAFVYQMITKAELLKDAKAAGFQYVQFSSKGGDGAWHFDLSGPAIPQCEVHQRLCL